MINFPLLKTFDVPIEFTNFLDKKFLEYSSFHKSNDRYQNCFTNKQINSGYQTDNLLLWQDKEYHEFINKTLLDFISKNLFLKKDRIQYFWNHFLSYENGGEMKAHTHNHNEDFVFFVYLNTCNSGDTVFYLNHFNEEYSERTAINVKPKKNLGVLFSSMLLHKGEYTEENKKIFVAGLRIDTRNKY